MASTYSGILFSLKRRDSRIRLFATAWTIARQAPLSVEILYGHMEVFSRQEYWSGLPCTPPGNLPDPGIEPLSPALQVDSLPAEPPRNYPVTKE